MITTGVRRIVVSVTAAGLLVAVSAWPGKVTPGARAETPPPADAGQTSLPPHLGYGVNVRLESNLGLVDPLGFGWVKLWEEYEDENGFPVPSERLSYNVLYTVDCRDGFPADLAAWGDGVEALAADRLGLVEAYEVCNEPNVERFWGGRAPDPAEYVDMLEVAYARIKAVDPGAVVVSAGLAPVGRIQGTCNGWSGNNCGAMDEREYARQMFLHGAGGYLDGFGYHPYGFAYEPERDAGSVSNGFAFRGAEVMYQIMDQHGLGEKPVWATEFNWLRDDDEDDYGSGVPHDCDDEYEAIFGWMELSEIEQANYITRAYQYADEHWPWMGPMFVWNLDWHNYHTWDCEAARYFSILYESGDPTPAYDAMAAMEKRPGALLPRLAVTPAAINFMVDVDQPAVFTATLTPDNSGWRVLTWTATVAAGWQVTPTLVITSGAQGTPLTVTVDSTGYATGTFTGAITVTATMTDVLDSPQVVPVTLYVVPEVYRAYLPVALRASP